MLLGVGTTDHTHSLHLQQILTTIRLTCTSDIVAPRGLLMHRRSALRRHVSAVRVRVAMEIAQPFKLTCCVPECLFRQDDVQVQGLLFVMLLATMAHLSCAADGTCHLLAQRAASDLLLAPAYRAAARERGCPAAQRSPERRGLSTVASVLVGVLRHLLRRMLLVCCLPERRICASRRGPLLKSC